MGQIYQRSNTIRISTEPARVKRTVSRLQRNPCCHYMAQVTEIPVPVATLQIRITNRDMSLTLSFDFLFPLTLVCSQSPALPAQRPKGEYEYTGCCMARGHAVKLRSEFVPRLGSSVARRHEKAPVYWRVLSW